MKVDGFNTDVRVESVLVEENCAACIVGHVKPFMKNIMLNILRCFLQGNNMPLLRNLLLKSVILSASGPRIPVVDAESLSVQVIE